VNGEWFIYDTGFYPYDYGYPYDYYPYEYDPGVYADDSDNYSQGAYDSSNQNTDSTVAAAQKQLAQQGYYRGEIDGIFGAETRRAIMRYQSDHGLRVTGRPDVETLRALELPRVGSN
jgi:peptidoglycan hydrolase-like protein with peptidoglycan-binding domain